METLPLTLNINLRIPMYLSLVNVLNHFLPSDITKFKSYYFRTALVAGLYAEGNSDGPQLSNNITISSNLSTKHNEKTFYIYTYKIIKNTNPQAWCQ